jgi:hypothetical protein
MESSYSSRSQTLARTQLHVGPIATKAWKRWSFFENIMRDCNNLPTDIANSNSHEIFKSRVTNNIKTPTSCFYLAFNNMHLTRIFNKINVDSIDSMEE